MIPAAQSRAIQRLLKTELVRIGIMPRYRTARLRIAFFLVRHFAVREFVADARVEIDALGEGRAKRVRDFFRHVCE